MKNTGKRQITGWHRTKAQQPIRAALSPQARDRRREWLLDARERLNQIEWQEREER